MKYYMMFYLFFSILAGKDTILIIDLVSDSSNINLSKNITDSLKVELNKFNQYKFIEILAPCSNKECAKIIALDNQVNLIIYGEIKKYSIFTSINVFKFNIGTNNIESKAAVSYKNNNFSISNTAKTIAAQLFKLNRTSIKKDSINNNISLSNKNIKSIKKESKYFSFIGFGLYGNVDLFKYPPKIETQQNLQINYSGFNNTSGLGLFFFLNFTPKISIALNSEIVGNFYKLTPYLLSKKKKPGGFPWGRGSLYLTIKKELWKKSIIQYLKTQFYVGFGINHHIIMPIMNIELIDKAFDTIGIKENINNNNTINDLSEILMNEENQTKLSNFLFNYSHRPYGMHFQCGIRTKLILLTSSFNYRYTIAKNIVPNKFGFSSFWLSLAFNI